jgi:hypothetical protein
MTVLSAPSVPVLQPRVGCHLLVSWRSAAATFSPVFGVASGDRSRYLGRSSTTGWMRGGLLLW